MWIPIFKVHHWEMYTHKCKRTHNFYNTSILEFSLLMLAMLGKYNANKT